VNQYELHPMLQQRDITASCLRYGVTVEAYSSLARCEPELMENEAVTGPAAAHSKTKSQVLLRWAVQHGFPVLPKSARPERIAENALIFDWELSPEEMAALDALDSIGLRVAWDPHSVKA
jgi:2,5-diketo-D-gluconate reductase A